VFSSTPTKPLFSNNDNNLPTTIMFGPPQGVGEHFPDGAPGSRLSQISLSLIKVELGLAGEMFRGFLRWLQGKSMVEISMETREVYGGGV
jgi:hypothetical protein